LKDLVQSKMFSQLVMQLHIIAAGTILTQHRVHLYNCL